MLQLMPHQEKAVEELEPGKILLGGVGTGKTLTSLYFFFTKICGGVVGDICSMRTPTDLIVITTAKKRDDLDWEKDAGYLGIWKDPEISAGAINFTVDSWNNIGKYKDVKDAFFIFDEQRVVGSGAWASAFVHIAKNNRWILLSATPGDTWMDYVPVFVANGFVKNRTEFKKNHVVYNTYSKFPKIERYTGVYKLKQWRDEILVEMPFERHTTREIINIEVEHDESLFRKALVDRWNVFEERPIRDVAELFSVMRKIVNGDLSRLVALEKLMAEHPKLIVFYNFDYELENLRSLARKYEELGPPWSEPCTGHWSFDDGTGEVRHDCRTGEVSTFGKHVTGKDVEFAEWNGHKHEDIPTSDAWLYMVQYVAGAEGWNCTATDAMAFYSLTYSYKNFEQAQGRIDRLNTPFTILKYYVMVSNSIIDKAILKALSSKQNFNESRFAA